MEKGPCQLEGPLISVFLSAFSGNIFYSFSVLYKEIATEGTVNH